MEVCNFLEASGTLMSLEYLNDQQHMKPWNSIDYFEKNNSQSPVNIYSTNWGHDKLRNISALVDCKHVVIGHFVICLQCLQLTQSDEIVTKLFLPRSYIFIRIILAWVEHKQDSLITVFYGSNEGRSPHIVLWCHQSRQKRFMYSYLM